MAQLSLTPEQLGKTQLTISDTQVRAVDQDNEGGIRHSNPSQEFDGSTYYPTNQGISRPQLDKMREEGASPDDILKYITQADVEARTKNQEIYESAGEPISIFGLETPFRQQKVTDDEGDPATKFVMTPDTSAAGRIIGGAGLEAVKGVAGTAEYLLDKGIATHDYPTTVGPDGTEHTPTNVMRWLADRADELLGTEFGETDVNFVDQNFLTIPAQNDMEALGQEIGAMIIGGVAGDALVQSLLKSGPAATALGKLVNNFYGQAIARDTANIAATKTQMFARMAGEFLGANVGSVITAPKGTESISGNFVPDIPGLGESENEKAQMLLDNTLLSGVGVGVAKLAGAVFKKGGESFGFGKGTSTEARQQNTVVQVVKDLDPGLAGASEEEVTRRVKLMSDMIEKHAIMKLPYSEETWKRSTTNAVARAAKEYTEEAYAFRKPMMTPEAWESFVNETSATIQNGMANFRSSNAHIPIVQAADAEVARRAGDFLERKADTFGDRADITKSGQAIAEPSVVRLNTTSQDANKAQTTFDAQDARATAFARDMGKEVTRDYGRLSNTVDAENRITNMAADLLGKTVKSIEETDAAYAKIPSGVNYNKDDLADLIIELGNSPNSFKQVGANSPGNLFRKPPTDPEQLAEFRSNLIADMPDDLKELYTKTRPDLAAALNAASRNPTPGQSYDGYKAIKSWIDDAAEGSNNPEFMDAKRLWAGDQNTMFTTDALENLRKSTQQGNLDFKRTYNERLLQSRATITEAVSDPSGIKLMSVIDAVDPNDTVAATSLAHTLVDIGLKDVRRSIMNGDTLTASTLSDGLAKYSNAIERLSPDIAQSYEDAITSLRQVEAGTSEAKDALAKANVALTQAQDDINSSIAYQFITGDTKRGFRVQDEGGVAQAFNNIFAKEDTTVDLLTEITKEGVPPEVLKGAQAQYLRYLTDGVTTSRNISGVADQATYDVKASRLYKILNSSDPTGMSVMKKMFADQPEFLGDLSMVLDEMAFDVQARQLRPQTFSSNTAAQIETNKRLYNTFVTVAFGQLSRPGATLRNIINNLDGAKRAAFEEEATKFLATILSDSTFFADTLGKAGTNNQMLIDYTNAKMKALGYVPNPTIRAIFQEENEAGQTKDAFGISEEPEKRPTRIIIDGANPIQP